jgi:hypothetical protein
MTKKITITILIAVTALVVGWDIYAAINSATGDTVSELLGALATKHMTLPFAIGFISGHLFWPRKTNILNIKHRYALWVVLFILLPATAIVDIFYNPGTMAFLFPPVGYVLGHFFWPRMVKA